MLPTWMVKENSPCALHSVGRSVGMSLDFVIRGGIFQTEPPSITSDMIPE